ncbi:ABC transporter ATP-binding protein [Clostridium felsineum]|uniref:Fatty acid ABC transporter ATP-binding/permease protein n=1 Tax=Clostridium felsineum TaxID=36839 RepID=A0A1S8LWT2_9CLOT|nr:ABC transporter ATP-binding protein [Clostridium felsineum]MCR3757675.1 ABC transporter ATP-binding protein/permease [Clostridium felsineum]URZ03279.1 Fatty acid ABC transporter ATP-binding/permease protein [Clostridium felsineum]URZ08387.1 Fatty acid ABC transporter ATP-binding/permease protein [Clostridium felsineum]URZ13418.1 Fatty acid ABC transporter ATP-binding/permease protein [Clostridium felsineum]URZ14607.1 Fatty acid ABC transporter ATP-binding/permease protein [Clostridium felsi
MSEKRQGGMNKGPGGGPPMGKPAEKAKDFKGTFRKLLKYLAPYKMRFLIVAITAIFGVMFNVVSPKIMGNATTKLADGIRGKITLSKVNPQEKKINDAIKKIDAQKKTLDEQKAVLDAQIKANPMMAKVPKIAEAEAQIAKGEQQISKGAAQLKAAKNKITKVKSDTISKYGSKIDFDAIGKIILELIALYAISSFFTFLQSFVMASVAQKTVYTMRRDVEEKLNRLPLKFFDSKTHGEILSRVTNDLDTVATTLQQSLTQLITSILQVIGVIVMMLTISGWLTLICVLTLPVAGFVTVFIAKKSQKFFAGQQKELGMINGHVEEMFTGHIVVKAFNKEKESIDKFNEMNDRLYKSGWKAQFMSGIIFPLMNFINNIGYVAVCVAGGIFATKGIIAIGDVQAFFQYNRLFTMPIIQTANIANIIQSTMAAAERVFELLDEEEEVKDADDSKVVELPKGAVRFENVKFGYKEGSTLIQNMNLDVKPGETVAIVGPTGAGKTTIVNLLMRFYEINDGKITIDNVNTREMKRNDLRGMFGMVLQDTWLFNGTIRENIAYSKDGATEEEIVRAAKAAHADHFIRTLPKGYDTVINEEASNISQGQKQLLTIARVILANPQILILDEATSSVDTRTELAIQKAMNNLMKGRTSFVIAHRLSTIRDADLILVMNQGSVIEQGNHKELLEKKGFYADLYNSQFTGGNSEDVG